MLRKYSTLGLLLFSALFAQAQDQLDKSLLMDYIQEQQYDKVIQYMENTVKPSHVNGLAILANAYLQAGQTASAEKTYLRVLELDSNHISSRQQLGNIARSQQQYKKAVEHYARLVALRPDNALYYKQLANAASSIAGLQDTAFALMKTSYQLNPKDASVVLFLAEEYADRENVPTADSLLKQYYQFDSANSPVTALLVKLSYQQEKFQEAVNYGEKLVSAEVMHPIAYLYLAVSHYSLKHYDSTIRVYDKMTALVKDSPETLKYYAALSYAKLKQFDKSNELLDLCIKAAKSRSLDSYYTALASNYEEMKQYRMAIAHYDTAFYLFKDPMRQYGIARIYDQYVQDPLKAKKYYQLFLKNSTPFNKKVDKEILTYAKERVKDL